MNNEVGDFSKLGIEERCMHKAWQARQSGYDMAAKYFMRLSEDKTSEWNRFGILLKEFITDKNAAALEKGIEAATVFLENCPRPSRYITELIPPAVQALAMQRPRTQGLAAALVLACMDAKPDSAVDELLLCTRSKNPKVTQASLIALREGLNQFGSKVVNTNKITKILPDALADRDRGTREEAGKLVVEIYRWGTPLNQTLSVIKPVQRSQLEAEFGKIPRETPVPKRTIPRRRPKKNDAAGEQPDTPKFSEIREEKIKPEPLAVEILGKLNEDFYAMLTSKKWTERRAAVDFLSQELADVQKLAPGEYGDLILSLINIVINDTNVVVIGNTLQCLFYVIKGLGKRFLPYTGKVLLPVVTRFKEKKQIIVKSCRNAIDALLANGSVEDNWADIKSGLDNKNPSIRTEMLMAMARWIGKQPLLSRKMIRTLVGSFCICLTDPEPSVRDSAAIAIASTAFVAGEAAINPYISELGEMKINKVKALYGKTELWRVEAVQASLGTEVPNENKPSSKEKHYTENKLFESREQTKIWHQQSVRSDVQRPQSHRSQKLDVQIAKKTASKKSRVTEHKQTMNQNEKHLSVTLHTENQRNPKKEIQTPFTSSIQRRPKSRGLKSPKSPRKRNQKTTVDIPKPGSPRKNDSKMHSDQYQIDNGELKNSDDILKTVRVLLAEGSEASCKLESLVGSMSTVELRQVFLSDEIKKEPRLWAEALSSLRGLLCIRGHNDPKIGFQPSTAAETANLSVRESALALMNTLQSIARKKEYRRLTV